MSLLSLPLPLLLSPYDGETSKVASASSGTGGISNDNGAVILRLCIDLPSTAASVNRLRRCVRFLMDGLCISREDTEDVEMALAELASNAVLHSCGEGYRAEVEFATEKIVMTVTDQGIGFPDEGSLPLPGTARRDGAANRSNSNCGHGEASANGESSTAAGERIGGFGLPLVCSLTDHVEIQRAQPQGTIVRAYKAVHIATKDEVRQVAVMG